jgi:hypothetical protein
VAVGNNSFSWSFQQFIEDRTRLLKSGKQFYDARSRFAEYIVKPTRIASSRQAPATATRQPQPIASQNVETSSAGTAIISSPLFIFAWFFFF